MARLFHDQIFNVHGNGAGAVAVPGKVDFTGQRKTRAGGRKPLGDLSNAAKPMNQVDGKKALDGLLNTGKSSVSQASKPLKSKTPTVIINGEAVSKAKNSEGNKRTVSKGSEKSRAGSRKALSDISNAGKPHVLEIKHKNSLKQSLHPSAIAEEQFLHNHQECIKSQVESLDVLQFFKTVGVEDDSDDDMTISFEQPAIRKLEAESAYLELEEVPELLPEVRTLSAQHGSPAYCKTPKLPSYSTMWSDYDLNFKLMDTPNLSKN